MTARDLVQYFQARFQEITGFGYLVNWGRDTKLMKGVLDVHGTRTKSLVDLFFDNPNDFTMEAGYTVPVFYSQVNKLATRLVVQGGIYGDLARSLQGKDAPPESERGEISFDSDGEGRVHPNPKARA